MNTDTQNFLDKLVIQFKGGLSSRDAKDGFYAQNIEGLELDGNESDGCFIKNTEENERILTCAVDKFVINARIALNLLGLKSEAIEDAWHNNTDFSDAFVEQVLKL